jgi:hypothetical protein
MVVPFLTIASSTVSHIMHNYLVIIINLDSLSCSFISISPFVLISFEKEHVKLIVM